MKNIIYCYLLRYSIEDALMDIANGFELASEERNATVGQKQELIKVATKIFELRNELRREKKKES